MTIRSFKEAIDNSAFFDYISDATEIWSNNACLGYVIAALQSMEYEVTEIARITAAIKDAFDRFTVDEAEKIYQKSSY